ncbi:Crp/Fnr family transcriptional regulator [Vogesella sp. DC21W]|uniref:Crp/Fnr family transcriptional regulator n=1 Tax=Vogesella aquatica TaxID=2984206 RepID=A0ABT5J025_9NEIS|nr:Crp/Fnr family transcriptional regulator [Vogesella aquatica]MDC7717875.1 Crp/Fnr family transcriptional regulator [Vogesella aquatica]
MTLTDYPPFSLLGARSQALLRQCSLQRHEVSPAPLLGKGQNISGAYVVLSGCLRVYTLTPAGHEATQYFIRPGETCVFALNSLFNDVRYPAWVAVEEAAEIAFIPGPVFRSLFALEPVMQDLTVRTLSVLVFRLMAMLEEMHACTLGQRLANLLLLHAGADGRVSMTQQVMANHLGSSREVVARLIGALVACGAVSSHRGYVCVRQAALLAARSGM